MLRKSIFFAAILFIAYECFLRASNHHWDTSQNDKSANIISIQNFLFDYSRQEISRDTVIVGTSVSRKLIFDTLGKKFINLAFNAWSTYDGLELVKRSRLKPACLMVETNYVKNQVLEPEIKHNLEPISYYSGKVFKSLQLRNQPIGLLIGFGKDLMKSRIDRMKEEKRENVGLYKFNIKMNSSLMNQPIPDSVLTRRFIVLKSLIDGFKKENIGILFYEVPLDEELVHSTSMLELRKYFTAYFPPSEFNYIPSPPATNFVFSDGVHLSTQSALDYSLYLKSEMNSLNARTDNIQ